MVRPRRPSAATAEDGPLNGKHARLETIVKIGTALPAIAAFLVFGVAQLPALASTPAPAGQQPATPNSCIELNMGDFNGCNVGNSGRGDLPYRHPSG